MQIWRSGKGDVIGRGWGTNDHAHGDDVGAAGSPAGLAPLERGGARWRGGLCARDLRSTCGDVSSGASVLNSWLSSHALAARRSHKQAIWSEK